MPRKSPRPAAASEGTPAPPRLPSQVRFRYAEVERSRINEAPYNPRIMDAGGRKKLREALKRFGLVEPLVWNERTGYLVGGHQRLAQLDALMGYPKQTPEYLVPCAVVDLDERAERELNVALNNPNLQGVYDFGKLEELFSQGTNPFAAGFEELDLSMMFGEEQAAHLATLYGVAGLQDDPHLGDIEAITKEAQKVEAIKARKREYLADQEHGHELPDNYLMIVYPSTKTKDETLAAFGLPPGTRVMSAERWGEIIDAQLERALAEAGLGSGDVLLKDSPSESDG